MGGIQDTDNERAIEDARAGLLKVRVPHESTASGQALLGIAVGGVFAAVPFVAIQVFLFPDFGLPIGFALGPLSVIAFVRYQEN